MAIYGYVWLCMTIYGYVCMHVWPFMYDYGCMMYAYERSCMALHDNIWLSMAMKSHVWLGMAMYGYVWLCMAMYKNNLHFKLAFKVKGFNSNYVNKKRLTQFLKNL